MIIKEYTSNWASVDFKDNEVHISLKESKDGCLSNYGDYYDQVKIVIHSR